MRAAGGAGPQRRVAEVCPPLQGAVARIGGEADARAGGHALLIPQRAAAHHVLQHLGHHGLREHRGRNVSDGVLEQRQELLDEGVALLADGQEGRDAI